MLMAISLLNRQSHAFSFGFAKVLLTLILVIPMSVTWAQDPDIAVLEFELKDLTLYPAVEAEAERVASLRPLLVTSLTEMHQLNVVDVAEAAKDESSKGAGYIFDRPKVAARLARAANAPWVVSGRLHKASHLFVYLKAQLVNAKNGAIAADFVVEIKGPQKKLTSKGVDALAQQITEALKKLATSQ